MYPLVQEELSRQAELGARRSGVRARRLQDAQRDGRRSIGSADVVIRDAEPADLPALLRLAELDSRQLPIGHVLIAKADGHIKAALSVDDGTAIADPFTASAPLEDLLHLRAMQIRRQDRRNGRGRGLRGVLHLRAGRAV